MAGLGSLRAFAGARGQQWPMRSTVRLRQTSHSAERFAAEHLCAILRDQGRECRLISGEDPGLNAPGQILIGVVDRFPSLQAFLRTRDLHHRDLGQDGYLIDFDQATMTMAIGSPTPRGVLYGAYALGQQLRKADFALPIRLVEKPALEWRYIDCSRGDMPFYRKLITEYAPRFRFNLLKFYVPFETQEPLWSPGWFKYYLCQPLLYRKYPKLNDACANDSILHQTIGNLRELSTLAAERDLVLFCVFPVLNYVSVPSISPHGDYRDQDKFLRRMHPEFFNSQGEPDYASPVVHQFINDQVEEFFELYPALGGLVGHTGEVANLNPSGMRHQTIPMDEMVLRVMQTVYDACRKHGKLLMWDMHSAAGDTRNSDAIIKAVKTGRFPGMMLTAESTYTEQEFSFDYPTSFYLTEMVKSAPSIFTQDCYGEGNDYNYFPFIVDKYLVRHFRNCERAGATGGGVLHYVYQGKYTAFNTLQNINLELQTRMMWEGGSINPEKVKRQWIEEHYGKAAASTLLKAFNRVNLILGRMFYIAKNGSWAVRGGLRRFTSLSSALGAPFFNEEFFSKPGTPLTKHYTRVTASVRAISMKEMRQEKQEAIDQCMLALRDLGDTKGKINQRDYTALLARFVAMWYYARACRLILEVLYYFKNGFLGCSDPEAKDSVQRLKEAGYRLEALVREARNDIRLRGLEEDVYRFGLEESFLQPVEQLCHDLAKTTQGLRL